MERVLWNSQVSSLLFWLQQGPVGREHCIWGCCVASAVHRSVSAALGAWLALGQGLPVAPPLLRHHLWLAAPPAGMHGDVWQVPVIKAQGAVVLPDP